MLMDNSLVDANRKEFLVEIAEFLLTWNQAERMAARVLNHLCGESAQTYILTAELGALGLTNALASMAADIVEPPFDEAIRYGIEYFDRVRVYRNYYIHGIRAVGSINDERAFGVIDTASAKGKFTLHEERIYIDKIREARMMAGNLTGVWTNIYMRFVHSSSEGQTEWMPLLEYLKTHPLPPKLQKPRRFPLNEPLPPQS
jgi:hypothetical protein